MMPAISALLSAVRTRPAGPEHREPRRRYAPTIEQLEARNLLATLPLIQLDGSGSGFKAGELTDFANPDEYEIRARVTGKISILMRAEGESIQSHLTMLDATPVDEIFVASQAIGALDHLIQFDAQYVGQTFQFSAGVTYDPTKPYLPVAVGPYRLFISTESTDYSAITPHSIPLDASGLGIQLGYLDSPNDQDLFSFTASATGRAFFRVNSGQGADQQSSLPTKAGQTFGILVSQGTPGPYVLTVHTYPDDFPDAKVTTIKLDPKTGSGSQAGRIEYVGDVDAFRFTARKPGIMTVTMVDDEFRFTGQLAVSSPDGPVHVTYDFSDEATPFLAYPRIVQFLVDAGVTYEVRASGIMPSIPFEGRRVNYTLSLDLVVDDFSELAGVAHQVVLDTTTATGKLGTQTGSIETPGDRDRFKFTAPDDGYAIVALSSGQATNMQGLLTFSAAATSAAITVERGNEPFSGIVTEEVVGNEVFADVGYGGTTRDQFAVIRVEKGKTYDFLVSAEGSTIGDYQLEIDTFKTSATKSFQRLHYSGQKFVQDTLNFKIPAPAATPATPEVVLTISTFGFVFPAAEHGTPSDTNTQLVGFRLPATNGGTPGTVTVPNGQSTPTANSLITTLLTVAARDNAVQSTNGATVAKGAVEVTPALLSLLLVGVVPSGGSDSESAPSITGKVFDDLDGNGRQDAGERGVAGETVVLEVKDGDKYVIVGTATTDANGAYAFGSVPPGDYRVRRIGQPGTGADLTTPATQALKLQGDSRPKSIDFGKGSKRGRTQFERPAVPLGGSAAGTWHREEDVTAELDQVFQAWHDEMFLVPPLDQPDQAATDWWLGVLALVPAAMLGAETHRQDRSSHEGHQRGAGRPPATA